MNLKLVDKPDYKKENLVIEKFSTKLDFICSNQYRAGIICLLTNSLPTNHSMKVEKLAYRLGIAHTTCIYHLELLKKYKLVTVREFRGKKRSVWGLYTKYPNWVKKVYHYVSELFTASELKRICSQNKSHR